MKFVRGNRPTAIQAIAKRLTEELDTGKRVLWLVSGGSNVALEVEIMRQVAKKAGGKLAGLAVLPIDERYGPPGHKDSNMEQLRQAGFEPGAAIVVDVLVQNVPLEQTVAFYNDAAATALANAQAVVGQFGMGADGHVAGIKPGSPACADDAATVVGYEWDDYTRLTLSISTLRQVTVAFLPAFGADKKPALERLRKNDEPFKKLPAKLLYDIPETYVYTDNDILGATH